MMDEPAISELIAMFILAATFVFGPISTAFAPGPGDDMVQTDPVVSEIVAEATEAADVMEREPEPQVPTGQFTTAVEIKQILTLTKPQWVAVREFDGRDLLYFTQLLSWRCGMWEIRYGLNGAPAETVLPLEPCHMGTNAPNALTDSSGEFPIYIEAPLGSIESVDVEVTFDDGTEDAAVYARSSILMP